MYSTPAKDTQGNWLHHVQQHTVHTWQPVNSSHGMGTPSCNAASCLQVAGLPLAPRALWLLYAAAYSL